MKKETIDDAFLSLVEWTDERKKRFSPPQLSAMLISTGCSIAFFCAPNKEEAMKVIQGALECAWEDYLKDKQN